MENVNDDMECQVSSINLLSLPVELLVYIMSLLVTRDLVKLRYVSRGVRVVTTTPLLWRKFVWPLYDGREERSIMNVLKDIGEYIKRIVFPNHVPASKLIQMIKRCRNVTHLILPAVTELDLNELIQVVKPMKSLKSLEVWVRGRNIEPLIFIGGLRELTIHVIERDKVLCKSIVGKWMKRKFRPSNLVLVTKHLGSHKTNFLLSFLTSSFTRPKHHVPCFKLFSDFQAPLSLFPDIPEAQLEFGLPAAFPFVKASKYGILGL